MSVVSRFGVIALALAMYSTSSAAPHAVAAPQAKAPCPVLNQIRGSLDDDVSTGIDGVRIVISSPYLTGRPQLANAETSLSMVSHGVTYMRDLNGDNIVPGLAPLLDTLDRANNDAKDAVTSLFQYGVGKYGNELSLASPQPSTWAAIDYAEQKKNDVYALVNSLQGNCTP